MAKEKLIKGEEFEDLEKFKRFVQMSCLQINKMNFEKIRENTSKDVAVLRQAPEACLVLEPP